jgi:tripartite-type tricarboxylate transporter receptor subunit TctC
VVRAVPDGQTLLIANSTLVLNQSLLSRLPFDAARDLVPVARVLESPLVIVVSNDNRFRSLSDLAAQARSQTVSIASTGTGSISHLGAALFGVHTRARFEYIPYRGGAPAVSDLMNGRAHAMFIEVAPVLSFIREGRLRALAVTSEKRVALLREVPTVAESGIRGYQAVQWYGVFAPTGTKRELTQKIARDLERVLMETAEEFHRFGQQASFLPPDRFAEFIKDELRTWSRVVKEKNIKLD